MRRAAATPTGRPIIKAIFVPLLDEEGDDGVEVDVGSVSEPANDVPDVGVVVA
jgi:hypothetical protein